MAKKKPHRKRADNGNYKTPLKDLQKIADALSTDLLGEANPLPLEEHIEEQKKKKSQKKSKKRT